MHKSQMTTTILLRMIWSLFILSCLAKTGTHFFASFSSWRHNFPSVSTAWARTLFVRTSVQIVRFCLKVDPRKSVGCCDKAPKSVKRWEPNSFVVCELGTNSDGRWDPGKSVGLTKPYSVCWEGTIGTGVGRPLCTATKWMFVKSIDAYNVQLLWQ